MIEKGKTVIAFFCGPIFNLAYILVRSIFFFDKIMKSFVVRNVPRDQKFKNILTLSSHEPFAVRNLRQITKSITIGILECLLYILVTHS